MLFPGPWPGAAALFSGGCGIWLQVCKDEWIEHFCGGEIRYLGKLFARAVNEGGTLGFY